MSNGYILLSPAFDILSELYVKWVHVDVAAVVIKDLTDSLNYRMDETNGWRLADNKLFLN